MYIFQSREHKNVLYQFIDYVDDFVNTEFYIPNEYYIQKIRKLNEIKYDIISYLESPSKDTLRHLIYSTKQFKYSFES